MPVVPADQAAGSSLSVLLRGLAPGLVLSGLLAAAGTRLADLDWMRSHGLSALTLAIVLGILVGNTLYHRIELPCVKGVNFSRQRLLRLGVVLYGLRLTVQDIGHVGMTGVMIDTVMLGSTFLLAYLIGSRWLGMDGTTAMLIGAGASICGAAAVMAAEPVVKGRNEDVAVSVATVVVFGTIGMFLYPLLFELTRNTGLIPGGLAGFGIYVGSTVHEVAQVVVAARSVGVEAVDTAVITKMVRVMMLAPFLVLLSIWLARGEAAPSATDASGKPARSRVMVPWFAFGFIGMVLFNSLQLLPKPVVDAVTLVDTVLLATAMAALGLGTQATAIRRAGARPLLLAWLLFVWLVVGGAVVNHAIGGWTAG